jgi:uncharacterized membrane protein YccC
MPAIRLDLGIRGVLLVAASTWIGLVLFQDAGPTGAAVLAGLLLLLADFHGDPWRRLRVYLTTALVGAALILFATATSGLPVIVYASLVAMVAGVIMSLRGTGGMLVSAGTCLTADLVVGAAGGISGTDPATFSLGALLGGLLATCLALVVLPAKWVSPVRKSTMKQIADCAQVLRGQLPSHALQGTTEGLIATYVSRPERPASPLPSALASVDLLSDLTLLTDVLAEPTSQDGTQSQVHAKAALILERSRAVLAEPRSSTARKELESAIREAPTGTGGFHEAVTLRSSLGIGRHALQMTARSGLDLRRSIDVFSMDMRVRLAPGGTLRRTGVASAILVGALILVAQSLDVRHPQWILLVAVSSFYPYLRRAATKAAATVVGTLSGVLVLWGLVEVFAPDSHVWWLVLLAATAVSMSSWPAPAGVFVGQGAFTLLSLTLLQLTSNGMALGSAEERLIDVALGALATVAVAALLAPRALRRRLRAAVAALLDTASGALVVAADNSESARAAKHERGQEAVLARSQFLRCVDIADVFANEADVAPAQVVGWINASRRAGQACVIAAVCDGGFHPSRDPDWAFAVEAYRRQAAALRANVPYSVPDSAHVDSSAEGRTDGKADSGCGAWLARSAILQSEELASLVDRST